MKLRICLCGLLFAATAATAAEPAKYPTRPIRIVIPQTPGGATDLMGRMIGQMLSERLGVPVVADNRAGSATIQGSDIAAKSAPDGYTMLIALPAIAILPAMSKSLPFDPIKDFAGIMQLCSYPNVVMVNAAVPAASIRELVALAKASPGKLNYASGGNGSATHIGVELFKSMAGINMVHVTYKGGGPAIIGLIANEVQMYFNPLPIALPLMSNAKLHGLAVTSLKPSTLLPALPTVSDSGVPGFEQTTWIGLVVPAKTPPDIIKRLYDVTSEMLKTQAVHERWAAQGMEVGTIGGQQFTALIKSENAKWSRVIKDAGIPPQDF